MTEERGDIATRFQKGNQHWKARSSHGVNPTFETKEELLSACLEYFEYCDKNPLVTYKPYVSKDGAVEQMEQIYPRPYNLSGLVTFLDICEETFRNYEKKPDFFGVCEKVRNIMRDQKLSGATCGYYNHAIVARDLQLKDASDVNVGGQDGNPLVTEVRRTIVKPKGD